MKGSCLCGAIAFTLLKKPTRFYRCHCSLCRKQSGVGYNLATIVRAPDFHWVHGEAHIGSWRRPTGYRTDFCTLCGSTVPNALRNADYVWLPIGLLEEDLALECAGDYCTEDAMPWDQTRSEMNHAGPIASLDSLLTSLNV